MTKRWKSAAGERGQATFSLILVLVVVAVAVFLLTKTARTAESINDKAGNIASSATGINDATNAVLKLDTTNNLADSILKTAQPLEAGLTEIDRLAKSIDSHATSINASASTINGTAKGINSTASTILNTARSINNGVAQINTNLDRTLALANNIDGDTTDILNQANIANTTAGKIDTALP